MLHKTDSNAILFVGAALGLFFIGGLLTTVVPPLIDKSWNKPFENTDPAKGPTGKLVAYTDQQMRGYKIYIREGCKYCHTQQTRTLASDVIRSGWKGVPSPVFRASAENTTSSGIRRTSIIRATSCPAPSCRPSRGSPTIPRNSTTWWLTCKLAAAPKTGAPTTTMRSEANS